MTRMSYIAGLVIGLAIAGVIAAAIIPVAINTIKDVSTTGWSAATIAVWGLLTLGVILAVAFAFFKYVT